jgi:hypothetical protein
MPRNIRKQIDFTRFMKIKSKINAIMRESTSREKEFENVVFKSNMAIIILTAICYILKKYNIIANYTNQISGTNGKPKIGMKNILKKFENNFLTTDFDIYLYIILLILVIVAISSKTTTNIKYSKNKGNFWLAISLLIFVGLHFVNDLYFDAILLAIMVLTFIKGAFIHSAITDIPKVDQFNENNQSFLQTEQLIDTPDSINLTYKYYFNGWRNGFINMLATTRATMVLGTAGSGKTASILEPCLWQSIYKGKSGIVYDYKFPSMSLIAYNALYKSIKNNPFAFGKNADGEPIIPKFEVINFTDLRTSSRVNPIDPSYIKNINSAQEIAKSLLVNLNRS